MSLQDGKTAAMCAPGLAHKTQILIAPYRLTCLTTDSTAGIKLFQLLITVGFLCCLYNGSNVYAGHTADIMDFSKL